MKPASEVLETFYLYHELYFIFMTEVTMRIIVIRSNDNSKIICSGLAAVWQNKRTGLFQFLGEHNGRPVFVVIEFPITNQQFFCIHFPVNFQFCSHLYFIILGHFYFLAFSSTLSSFTFCLTFIF